ncbi:hypothetical protein CVT25_004560 [Psilocybe cyanescens]|uniref:O-methylsterigmatocystin oxidoreductase n=1 Tax=Psilocybe cyanescens TaxID=93625 RepID=A0A409W374_PSICY|nr:hypothetical protein CVT25_004560 [Psilocybe cyanescens]
MASRFPFLEYAVLAFAGILLKKLLTKKSEPLPPGPRKLPLIGNFLDMPSSQEWFTFTEWGKKWGDIVSISVFSQQIVILNTIDQAIEMLDKKSSIYSDRPVMQMGGEMVGWKNTLGLTAYGERFRKYRKLFHQVIGTHSAMSRFYTVEETETRQFLKRVLSNPDDLAAHVRKTAGAIILRISHGYEVKEKEDPFVTLADEATDQFSLSTAPGVFLVNLVPALRHVPQWFPGAGFKKIAAEWAQTLVHMAEKPHQFVKEQIAYGTAKESFTSQLLESPGFNPSQEHDIMWSAASLYSGGADTTVSAIYAIFLAAVLNPEATQKAQKELDRVVGRDRLPTFADREHLPYTNAFVLEVLRWHSVTPTGVPHRVTEDNVHANYLIPKGALIITNIWMMAHDTRVYSDSFHFKPERFLGRNPERDPRDFCFGFGRRYAFPSQITGKNALASFQFCYVREYLHWLNFRCLSGSLLADSSMFISCAMSLSVFDITKYSSNGVVVEPVQEQTTGTISHLKPFKCLITPRTPKAVSLINDDEL